MALRLWPEFFKNYWDHFVRPTVRRKYPNKKTDYQGFSVHYLVMLSKNSVSLLSSLAPPLAAALTGLSSTLSLPLLLLDRSSHTLKSILSAFYNPGSVEKACSLSLIVETLCPSTASTQKVPTFARNWGSITHPVFFTLKRKGRFENLSKRVRWICGRNFRFLCQHRGLYMGRLR